MALYMTTKEASDMWGISSRRINTLCKSGRIEGAYKENNQWFIPSVTKKPIDKRYKKERGVILKEEKNFRYQLVYLIIERHHKNTIM